MIRCSLEVTELSHNDKSIESRAVPFLVTRRLAFEDMLKRDELRWRGVTSSSELRGLAERTQRELVAGDFQRFVDWMASVHGHSFVRSAGLPVGRPRLELAS